MRDGVFIAATLWLAPVIAVGLIGVGLTPVAAIALGLVAAAAMGWWVSGPLAATLSAGFAGRRALTITAVLMSAVAIAQIARESVYMADSTQPAYSVIPGDPWRVEHSCMSAYFEAARFAQMGAENVYDATLYQPRHIGALKVDSYHYPPPFLLLPRALRLITTDFFQFRALWFAMQTLVFAGAMAGIAVWIGETIGAFALLGGLAVLTTPTVLYSLQMGNFQTTAVALGAIALVLLVTQRFRAGAPILAYVALSKIFPGLLVVYLLLGRRWRAVAWTAAAGVALVALTFAIFGTEPFSDFVHSELPAISNGHAFPQSERPNVAASNQSIYGLTVRLRLLGAGWLDQPIGLKIASLYGLIVVALTALAGWKDRIDLSSPAGRAMLVQTGLALISLASFRSPFVGGGYGLVSTLWLLTLLAAGSRSRQSMVLWSMTFVACAVVNRLTPSPYFAPTTFWLAASAGILVVALGVNSWTVLRLILARPSRSPLPAKLQAPGT
ncbi:MAG: alpha,2-mannosyltransferase [Gammaproteobacteria bacterium]|nr:alpha,2-mannosyltransferase [Gammaproteobacteria bacterium]